MGEQKQSSRAPFNIRRDTVKLHNYAHFVRGKNKVAVPPSIPQITALKLGRNNSLLFNYFFTEKRHFKKVLTRDILTLL